MRAGGGGVRRWVESLILVKQAWSRGNDDIQGVINVGRNGARGGRWGERW